MSGLALAASLIHIFTPEVATASDVGVKPPGQTPMEIVVESRAPLLPRAPGASSTATSSLGAESLHGAGESLGDVLERVPGVQIARSGTQSDMATASIRGAEGKQVPVYLAGIRLNDEVSGTADLSLAPLQMLDRVDVYRGNAPFEADRLGMGGAIFLRLKRPAGLGAGAGALAGSFGERGVWAYGSTGVRQAATLVSVEHLQAENDFKFVDDRGLRFDRDDIQRRRRNADFSQTNAWTVGSLRHRGVQLRSVLNAFRREQGIAGIPAAGISDARSRTHRLLAGVSGHIPCPDSHACSAEFATSWVHAQSVLTDPLRELASMRTFAEENAGSRLSQDLRFRAQPTARISTVLGVHAGLSGLDLERGEALPHKGRRSTVIGKGAATWTVTDAVKVNGVASLECHTTHGENERFNQTEFQRSGACAVLEPVGRLGLQWFAPHGLEFLANVGRYVRPPLLSELYGSSAYVTGAVELKPEVGYSADAGLRWSHHQGSTTVGVDAFAFARTVNDLIRYRRSGPQSVSPFNVRDARLLGTEFAVSVESLGHVRVYGAATVLDPRETTNDPLLDPTPNDILPFAARLSLFSQLEFFTPTPGLGAALSRVALSTSVFHKSSRFADSAGQTVLPSQELVDLELSTQHVAGALRARASIRNLFNQQTLDFIGLPLPGRAYHAALEAHY